MSHERVENAAADIRQLSVEMVFQTAHRHGFIRGTQREDSAQQRLLVRLQLRPLGAVFLQNEIVVFVMEEAEHALALMLFDDNVAAYGEINDGSGDVAHVGGVIHERAGLAWSELIGRLVLWGDGTKPRIAAIRPPQIKHDGKRQNREA